MQQGYGTETLPPPASESGTTAFADLDICVSEYTTTEHHSHVWDLKYRHLTGHCPLINWE